MFEKTRHQGGRTRPIDIVVAKNGHGLATQNGIGNTACRIFHICERRRVGHEIAQRRIDKFRRVFYRHPPPGKHACNQIGNAVMLRNGKRRIGLPQAKPVYPFLSGCGLFYSEEKALCRHKFLKTQKAANGQDRRFLSRQSAGLSDVTRRNSRLKFDLV